MFPTVMAAKSQIKEAFGMRTLESGTASFITHTVTANTHTHTPHCQHSEAKGNMQEMLLCENSRCRLSDFYRRSVRLLLHFPCFFFFFLQLFLSRTFVNLKLISSLL